MSARNYEKCERCRKAPATLECIECGTSQRAMKHCYECDKQYHKMFEKENHTRITIKFDQMGQKQSSNGISSPLRRHYNEVSSKSPLRTFQSFGGRQGMSMGNNMQSTQASDLRVSPHFNDMVSTQNTHHQPQLDPMMQTMRSTHSNNELLSPTLQQSLRSHRELDFNLRFDEQQLSSRLRDTSLNKSGYKQQPASYDYRHNRQDSLSPPHIQNYAQRQQHSPLRQKVDQPQLRTLNGAPQQYQSSIQLQPVQNQNQNTDYYQTISPRRLQTSQSHAQLQNPQFLRSQSSSSLYGNNQLSSQKVQPNQVQQPQQTFSLAPSSNNEGSDLTVYYQRMAEDYRQKYLELEREYIFLKNGHDYEIQKVKAQVDDAERRFNDKLIFETQEMERRFRETLGQKDLQINILQKQLIEMENKIQQEAQELISMSKVQQKIENDYQETYKELEKAHKEREERLDRLQKEHDYQVQKQQRLHDQEKDCLKKDYESLLQSVRDEYYKCNKELKSIIDSKTDEVLNLSLKLKQDQEDHRKERNELEETLHKDKYHVDLCTMEIEKLRQAKGDFDQEREQLYNELKNMEAESDRWFTENKELKRKIKKLEHILYGKK
ncbi:UNKNOWN [Stylonychia lemnae]|uniref:Uncharacterized protein n=1 Tax=Stylonychia lemnae TaxID=5949 RepID=A0A078BBA5_STYLE|nr:UNKNOWN [Stylonychia lemnae]|eukprot:CDW90848.1 UNKNOWN [Stylonychia lemnae]